MKRNVLALLMSALMMIAGMNMLSGQDQPKPKKDTVNIDTDAKPTFYYAEDEQNEKESRSGLIIGIVAGVIVLAGAGFYLARKKK